MLCVNDLCVNYGATQVVSHVDLQLADDEILMLVGPTGCGKTTILQALAGLIPIAQGSIALPNWSATATQHIPPEKRNVGMVFQDFALFPHLTVEQNVCFRLNDPKLADHWLSLLGLEAFRTAKPGRLSGGQKQRVALARALAHEPSLMLLDEPLSNLDAAMKDSLRWEIRHALKSAGVPAVWVTHDQDEALSIGDSLGVLKNGKLEQIDTPSQCFSHPANRFVASFLGEASFITGKLNNGTVSSIIGDVPVTASAKLSGKVDVLIRPDDCSLTQTETDTNGGISTARYEGETWLYLVEMDDGTTLKVRTNHEIHIKLGARVSVKTASTQALAAFAS